MPVHKRRPIRKKVKKGKIWPYLVIFSALALIAFLFLTVTSRGYWSEDSKLSLVINNPDGSATVSVFDPKREEIININIPSNTEVEVAHQLGLFKLGSVWRLGENEGLGGELLAATLRHQFKFPVSTWADSKAVGFSDGNLINILEAIKGSYKTNMKMGDRLALGTFSLGIKNTKRTNINLSETPYLVKTTLKDGEEGYVVSKNISQRLLSIFANDVITENSYKVEINDSTGNLEVSSDVGGLMEVMGAKVASIVKKDQSDFDCRVSGYDKKVVKEVARILSCEQEIYKGRSSFDLEIDLGSQFVEKF